jgi:hypothetical protein
MIGFLAMALPAVVCAADVAPAGAALPIIASDSLKAAFESGQRWTDFYPTINRRKETWDRTLANAKIPDSLATRARSAGAWKVLVITEPGCSDSANSVPLIARLAELVPSLELRLVNSTIGKPWMEAHRTPDGRPATPTVLLLDDTFRIRGCWVEQPKALQDFWLPIIAKKETGARFEEKMAWYVKDDGREILRELVEMLEGAKGDAPVCRRAQGGPG